jgi:GTP cyclohydrolase IA
MDINLNDIRYLNVLEEARTEETPYDGQIADLTQQLLLALGEDPEREGLQRTPARVARMYAEILSGYQTDPVALVNGAIFDSDYRNMVLVRDIEFHSLCEHHMLPFSGKAHVAYLPEDKIIGLSKIPRLVEMYARRLQVQERLTGEIAAALDGVLKPRGVAVQVEATHLCAVMRGVKQSQASMLTTTMLGAFEDDERLRAEFFTQVNRSSFTS